MIAVLGASGQLGSAFIRLVEASRGFDRLAFDLASFDAARFSRMLDDLRPDAVINCAAYTAVDRAEGEEELATRINGISVGSIAEVCADRRVRFVSFSTDYVFDGHGDSPYLESHPTDPVNAYGRSKLAGERAVAAVGSDALVVRTSWVVSGTHPNFVRTMLDLVGSGRELTVVSDQRGCPTVVDDLVVGTMEALGAGATGLLHLTNQGETTWFELAQTAVGMAGLDPGAIAPCTTEEYPTPAARPAYSVLGSEVRDALGLQPLPPWRESLVRVVEKQMARG